MNLFNEHKNCVLLQDFIKFLYPLHDLLGALFKEYNANIFMRDFDIFST